MTIREAAPARPPPPAPPGPGRGAGRYLAAAFLVLAAVLAVAPHQDGPAAPTWDYQRERVALEGGGALNVYARWAVGATAFLTRGSIERQRDVHRLSPLDFHAGKAAAPRPGRLARRHRLPLEGATLAAVCTLAAWGTLAAAPTRGSPAEVEAAVRRRSRGSPLAPAGPGWPPSSSWSA